MTIIKLYELVGLDERYMSPFCWRAKMALAHKNLDFEIVPVKFSEKHKLAFSGQEQVPVIVDAEQVVSDSWSIACYLEDNYPDKPALFPTEDQRRLIRVFNHWFDELITMKLFPLVLPDNFDVVHPEDMHYYVKSRKQWTGKTREELTRDRSENDFILWRASLEPLREQLMNFDYFGGNKPNFQDYIVFSTFMWARAVSPWPIIKAGDSLYDWREKMLGLYGGLAGTTTGYHY